MKSVITFVSLADFLLSTKRLKCRDKKFLIIETVYVMVEKQRTFLIEHIMLVSHVLRELGRLLQCKYPFIHRLLPSPPLSERRCCVVRRHALTPLHHVSTARNISLGGEGNALYPMLSSLCCYFVGKLGQWYFRTSDTRCEGQQHSFNFLCRRWYTREQRFYYYYYWNRFTWLPPCPCWSWQAVWDWRFDFNWYTGCATLSFGNDTTSQVV